MSLSVSDLLKMTMPQLDALYGEHEPGPIPDGETKGTAIVAPGSKVSDEIAKLVEKGFWKGKVFDAGKGVLRNTILPIELKAIVAAVYPGDSWLDGKPCIVIDYSKTSILKKLRDEMRQIQPGLYLGKVFWGKKHVIDFALET